MRTLSSMTQEHTKLLALAGELVNKGLRNNQQKAEHKNLLAEADILAADIAMFQTIDSGLRNNPAHNEKPAPVSAEVTAMLSPEQRRERRDAAYLGYFTGRQFEARDLTTSSDGSGAALIAQDWQEQWTAALKQFGPLASMVRLILKTEGSPTKVPLVDNTSQTMTYQADAGSVDSMEADPSVSSIAPSTDTLVSFTKASVQLYRDAQIEGGLEGFVKDNLFSIAARALETALLSGVDGSGTSLPSNPSLLSNVTTGATTASDSAITYSELLNGLYHSVDAMYRNATGAAFYASQTTHDYIAGMLDSSNRPIFRFDDKTGLLMVFGKPVYVAGTASGMSSIGTASKPVVLFGDFSRALVAVQRPLQTRVLVERFMGGSDGLQVGFVSHLRIGSAAGISGAVKALNTPAS